MSKWYNINRTESGVADIYLTGIVGWEVTASEFIAELLTVEATTLHVHINSEGGSVFDGLAIYNFLRSFKGEVITYTESIAASIASIMFLAGNRRLIGEGCMYMVHNPWSFAVGEAKDMRKTADILDSITAALSGIYQRATGKSAEDIAALMADESWFNAVAAIEHGFATGTFEPEKIAAQFDLSRFSKVPQAVLKKFHKEPSAQLTGETHKQKDKTMNDKLKGKLVAMGIRAEVSEEALQEAVNKITSAESELTAAKDKLTKQEEESTEEQARIKTIAALGAKHGLSSEASQAIEDKTSVDAFKDLVIDKVSASASNKPTRSALGKDVGEVSGYTGNGDKIAALQEQLKASGSATERFALQKQIRDLRKS